MRLRVRTRGVPLALTAAGLIWLAANVVVLVAADGRLPFGWRTADPSDPAARLLDANLALLEVLLLISLVWWLTRRRDLPDLAARAPERSVAARETGWLLLYGAAGLAGGFVLARVAGWHPFGLHLAGSIYGSHAHISVAEATTWAAYNLIVYAVIPLVWFGRRYSTEALNLRSNNRRADAKLILIVLLIESAVQILALQPDLVGLSGQQLAIGLPATFFLYLAGAVLPAMIFVYAILVPRFLRLTGSMSTTIVLGGLTYTALHVWDAWTDFGSPANAAMSVAFLLLTYFAPGMFKTVLTVRTGNAWVHVWAYHAIAPHTLADTPHLVHQLHIR